MLSNRLGKIGFPANNRLFFDLWAELVFGSFCRPATVVRPNHERHAGGRSAGAGVPTPARSMPLVSFRKLTATVEMTAATAR